MGDRKNFSKLQVSTRNSHSEVFCKKMLIKFCKSHRKTSLLESIFLKSCRWKPETVRSSHWKSFVKNGVLKKTHWCFRTSLHTSSTQNRCFGTIHTIRSNLAGLESIFNKAAVVRACNFIKEDSNIGAFLWNLLTF